MFLNIVIRFGGRRSRIGRPPQSSIVRESEVQGSNAEFGDSWSGVGTPGDNRTISSIVIIDKKLAFMLLSAIQLCSYF